MITTVGFGLQQKGRDYKGNVCDCKGKVCVYQRKVRDYKGRFVFTKDHTRVVIATECV